MASMSYCKWENTATELLQCVQAVEEGELSEDLDAQYERPAKKRCVELARKLIALVEELDPEEE